MPHFLFSVPPPSDPPRAREQGEKWTRAHLPACRTTNQVDDGNEVFLRQGQAASIGMLATASTAAATAESLAAAIASVRGLNLSTTEAIDALTRRANTNDNQAIGAVSLQAQLSTTQAQLSTTQSQLSTTQVAMQSSGAEMQSTLTAALT